MQRKLHVLFVRMLLAVALLPIVDRSGWADTLWPLHIIHGAAGADRGADGTDLYDIDGDGDLDLVSGWEWDRRVNVYFHPSGVAVKAPWPRVDVQNPIGVSDVEDAIFTDLDADGRADVVSCMEGNTRRIAIHWGPANPSDPLAWQTVHLPAATTLNLQWMRSQIGQIDGVRGGDLVAGAKLDNAGIYWFESPPVPRNVNTWTARRIGSVEWTMSLELYDMDGDGDLDVLVSDRPGRVVWFENPLPGSLAVSGWTEHLVGTTADVRWLTVVDLDQDGLQDIVTSENNGETIGIWYRRRDTAGTVWNAHPIRVSGGPPGTGTSKSVAAADLDDNGRIDLVFTVVGSGNCVYWLEYTDSPFDTYWRSHNIAAWYDRMKFDNLQLTDMDGDGDLDMVTSEEVQALGVIWYENPFEPIRSQPLVGVY